jgi:hypothetical protein
MAVRTDLISFRERLEDLCFDFEPGRAFLGGEDSSLELESGSELDEDPEDEDSGLETVAGPGIALGGGVGRAN